MDNFNENIMDAMLQSAVGIDKIPAADNIQDEISIKEFIDIYNEIIQVMANHNISYRCGCRIAVAMADAFLKGAVDLYMDEVS